MGRERKKRNKKGKKLRLGEGIAIVWVQDIDGCSTPYPNPLTMDAKGVHWLPFGTAPL